MRLYTHTHTHTHTHTGKFIEKEKSAEDSNYKEKKEIKLNIKEAVKQEKGAISTLVLFTVLMFVTILMSVFITVGIRQKSGLKSGQRVAEVYEEDVDRITEVYSEVISKDAGSEELEKLKEELAQANATEDKILKDYKAYANGKLLTGTMPNREATTDAVSIAASGDYAYIRMPQGGYLTNASSGYPEIKASIADINNATGYKYTQSQYDESYNNGYNAASDTRKVKMGSYVSTQNWGSTYTFSDLPFEPYGILVIPNQEANLSYNCYIYSQGSTVYYSTAQGNKEAAKVTYTTNSVSVYIPNYYFRNGATVNYIIFSKSSIS